MGQSKINRFGLSEAWSFACGGQERHQTGRTQPLNSELRAFIALSCNRAGGSGDRSFFGARAVFALRISYLMCGGLATHAVSSCRG